MNFLNIYLCGNIIFLMCHAQRKVYHKQYGADPGVYKFSFIILKCF